MMRLGLSLYPEQESLEEIEQYLATAVKYGFKVIFMSLFSIPGTTEEVVTYVKRFTELAHKYNMEVSADCNYQFFDKIGATVESLAPFKAMGLDILRMDTPFNDERDAILINNDEGLKIEMSTIIKDSIELAIKNGADHKRLSTCHNFYPERYSGPTLESINSYNEYWKERDIPVSIFITSREPGTHGPSFGVSHGLPTIEEHRNLPIEAQLKHMIALKNVAEVRLGNAFASEAEMQEMDKVLKAAYVNMADFRMKYEGTGPMAVMVDYLPQGDIVRIPFKLHVDSAVTSSERKLVFDFPSHCDLGDCLNYMLRSRFTRFMTKDNPIPYRPCEKKVFTRGDVVVVNTNGGPYEGEVQIVLKDMQNDGERNFIGSIDPTELMILNHMGKDDIFTFLEA